MSDTSHDIRLLLGKSRRLRLAALLACLWLNSLCELLCLAALPLFIQVLFAAGGMAASPTVQRMAELAGQFMGRNPANLQEVAVAAGAALLALNAVRTLWMYVSLSLLERYLARRKTELAGCVLEASLAADAEFRMANPDSALVNSCIQDALQSVEDVLSPLLGIANNAAVLICLVIALLWQMPAMTVIAVGGLALFCGGFTWFNSRRQSRLGLQAQQGREAAALRAGEALGISDAAIRQGRCGYFARRFRAGLEALAKAQQHYKVSNQIIWPYLEFTSFAVMMVVMMGFMNYGAGGLAAVAPQIAMLGLALVRLRTNSINLLSSATTLRYGLPVLHRLRMRLEATGQASMEALDNLQPLPLEHGLSLEEVRYSYPATEGCPHPAVDGVSLCLSPGELLGIAGTTGCGKSTLLRLMCGELAPTGGQIRVDGRKLQQEMRLRWRRSCGYVPQEPFLLDADMDSNIALGSQGEDSPVHAQALQEAKIGACIAADAGQDTAAGFAGRSDALGERGTKLSGGQRQRIAVARALYGGGCALFLDEATSALDNTTQELLERSLRELCRQRRLAVAIVAHRLSAIRHCDRILFMDCGRIIASGTYDDLLATCPAFRQMAES